MPDKVSIFLSYPGDLRKRGPKGLFDKLVECLRAIPAVGEIFIDVKKIPVGDNWKEEIENKLSECDFAVLAIAKGYEKSKYCQHEMEIALQRGMAVPIVIQPVAWIDPPYRQVNALPIDSGDVKPVTKFRDQEQAWEQIRKKLGELFKEYLQDLSRYSKDPVVPIHFHLMQRWIRDSLKGAVRFSLMARSGQGYWEIFGKEFERIIRQRPRLSRVLVLNPNSAAFEASNVEWVPFVGGAAKSWSAYKQDGKDLIERIAKMKVDLRLLDAHIPFTMLLVHQRELDEAGTTVFVEYPKFTAEYQAGQFRMVTATQHRLHNEFCAAFNTFWATYGSPRNSP